MAHFKPQTLARIKHLYRTHKLGAKGRGIAFNLTFEDWFFTVWLPSGHWYERGNHRGQYCMSRYGDKGAYELGNVFIQLHDNNVREAKLGVPKTAKEIQQRLDSLKVAPPEGSPVCEHCGVQQKQANYVRRHGPRCKQNPENRE